MEKLFQAVEITFIGMTVVFIVLALLSLLLKIQGLILTKLGGEKEEEEKGEELTKTSPANPKLAAAITAALEMYKEDNSEGNGDSSQ